MAKTTKATSAEDQLADLTNSLIELLWPMLDNGLRRDEIECCIQNALDSWEPEGSEPL